MPDPSPADAARYKQQAAERAVDFVASGMVVGLGTGSTSIFAIRKIGALLRTGELRDVVGVPTSATVEREARECGVPIRDLESSNQVDLTIDGADEVDPALNLIKGGGGALLREKIVAEASRREVIVVDQSKLSPRLGTRRPLPVEVVQFGWRVQAGFLESLGARVEVRSGPDGAPLLSDQGNLILLAAFGPLALPTELADQLTARAGIVEHGLFLDIATDLVVAGPGGVEHRTRPVRDTAFSR
jgi:ribose 5-phosphate isomerase A